MKKVLAIFTLALTIVVNAVGQSPKMLTKLAEATPSVELSQPNRSLQAVQPVVSDFTRPAFAPAAPATALFSEGFETTPTEEGLPTGWTDIPTPGGNSWSTAGYPGLYAHSGSKFASIYYHETVAHNAWLFSPVIALTAGTAYRISFWVQMEGDASYEKLEVKIGNAATVAGMTNLLYDNSSSNISSWTQIAVNFTPTASGNFHIGFHAYSPAYEFYIVIDDIAVSEVPANDLQIVADYPYTQVPVSQYIPSAKAKNVGTAPQTNVTLSASLNGTAVGSSAPVASLAAGATSAELTITPAVNVVEGHDSLIYTVTATETDGSPLDNSATIHFKGTQNLFATDNVTAINGVGSNGGTITFGNIFTINNATTLSQVMIAFGDAAALDYSISLYSMTGDLTVAASPIFTHAATRNATGFSSITVPSTPLPVGRYFLCVNQLTSTNIAVSYDGVPTKALYIKSGNNLSAQAGFGAVGIRMIMEVADCADPTNLAVVPDYTSAAFSWEGSAASYTLILNDGNQNYSFSTAENSITITGMTAVGTTYTWKVVALCDATHHSDTIDGTPFTTLCSATTINTFPWEYGFEDASFECWEQINVAGTEVWQRMEGNAGYPAAAHEGTYNIVFKNDTYTPSVTKLLTPKLDITGLTNPSLIFWHTQTTWDPDQDTLKVYYKTSSSGAWNLLATYSTNITAWTKEQLALPNASGDYYIAFEGTAVYGRGIALDAIRVYDYTDLQNDVGAVAITQPSSGALLTAAETVTVTVKNFGSNAVSSIPVALEVNGTFTVKDTITETVPSLAEHSHTFSIAADLSAEQTHTLKAYTLLPADTMNVNDTVVKQVINYGNVTIMGAAPEVTTCATSFVDDGIYGNYAAESGVVQTMKFVPATPNDRMRVTFTEFKTVPYQIVWVFEVPGDTLFVYDGTVSPENRLAALTGDLTGVPLTFESETESGALIFVFHKNSGNQEAGWKADVACFTPKAKDVKLKKLTVPAAGALTSSETVTVTIKNMGLEPLTDIPVVCSVNGAELPAATIPGPLAPLASVTQNFTADLSVVGSYNIVAYANLSTDLDHTNDTLSATTQCLPPTAIMWDFEGGMPDNLALRVLDNGIASNVNIFPNNQAWAIYEGDASVQPIGTKCAVSQSWFSNGAIPANRWMITPKLALGNVVKLQWDARCYEAGYPDGYVIKLSTSDDQTSSFTNTLLTVAAEQPEWTNHIIDLSAYSGQSVYIAFIQNSTDMNLLMVDNIKVLGNANIVGIVDYADIDNSVNLFPNPAKGTVSITSSSEIRLISIYNQTGQSVYSTVVSGTSAQINLPDLSTGLYAVRIQTAAGVSTKKLLISK